jgi:hypothetical protein
MKTTIRLRSAANRRDVRQRIRQLRPTSQESVDALDDRSHPAIGLRRTQAPRAQADRLLLSARRAMAMATDRPRRCSTKPAHADQLDSRTTHRPSGSHLEAAPAFPT